MGRIPTLYRFQPLKCRLESTLLVQMSYKALRWKHGKTHQPLLGIWIALGPYTDLVHLCTVQTIKYNYLTRCYNLISCINNACLCFMKQIHLSNMNQKSRWVCIKFPELFLSVFPIISLGMSKIIIMNSKFEKKTLDLGLPSY